MIGGQGIEQVENAARDLPMRSGPFFVLRTPSLPYSDLLALRQAPVGDDTALRALLARPMVREAIYLSSGSLYEELYERSAETIPAKAALAASRYLYRMASRSTPFGVLAGISTGKVASRSDLQVNAADQARRFCRLDQGALQERLDRIKANILAAEQLDAGLVVTLNSSAWRAPDGIRYAVPHTVEGHTSYRLAMMKDTAAILAVFAAMQADAPVTIGALAAHLTAKFPGGDERAVAAFLRSLLNAQLLRLAPDIFASGDERACRLMEEIDSPLFRAEGADDLFAAQTEIEQVGHDPIANIARYRAVAEIMQRGTPSANAAKAAHIDLFKEGVTPTLSASLLEDVSDQVHRCRKLLVKRPPDLDAFTQSFEALFGDRAVPLLEALDSDFGVVFGSNSKFPQPLLRGFPFANRKAKGGTAPNGLDETIARKLEDALRAGTSEIVFDDGDLAELDSAPADEHPLPSGFSMLGIFHGFDADSADAGSYWFEPVMFQAPSAVGLMSRFCVGSPELTREVRDFVADREAEQGGAIIAEFTHLPEGRVGNVVLRPNLRRYEIPFLGRSAAAADRQIPVSDVYLAIRHHRLVMFSKALGRPILPRLTTAHNHMGQTNLPLYQFIGAFQRQNEASIGWVWPSLLQTMPFLPRVRAGKLLLARARWNILPKDLATLLGEVADSSADAAVEAFMARHAVAPAIRCKRGDNFIDLDLRHARDRALFLEESRRCKLRGMILEETFHDESAVADPAGYRFCHEVLVPFSGPQRAERPAPALGGGERCYAPGSEYLYAKLFAGTEAIDRIVATVMPHLSAAAERIGVPVCFFIRYFEGGPHLRLRMGGGSPEQASASRAQLEAMVQPFLADGRIRKLEYATYFPEYGRYGGEAGIAACERIFTADSIAAAEGLSIVRASPDREGLRWQFALESMTGFLDALGADRAAKLAVFEQMLHGYSREFSVGESGKLWLNDTYRQHKRRIDPLFLDEERVSPFSAVLARRDAAIREAVEQAELDWCALQSFSGSLLHMVANRIVPENARAHELVLFSLLTKGLRAAIARSAGAGRRAKDAAPPDAPRLAVTASA